MTDAPKQNPLVPPERIKASIAWDRSGIYLPPVGGEIEYTRTDIADAHITTLTAERDSLRAVIAELCAATDAARTINAATQTAEDQQRIYTRLYNAENAARAEVGK